MSLHSTVCKTIVSCRDFHELRARFVCIFTFLDDHDDRSFARPSIQWSKLTASICAFVYSPVTILVILAFNSIPLDGRVLHNDDYFHFVSLLFAVAYRNSILIQDHCFGHNWTSKCTQSSNDHLLR